jgi:squalene-hopene/tetraprenyl-beta-curcumene cyclase
MLLESISEAIPEAIPPAVLLRDRHPPHAPPPSEELAERARAAAARARDFAYAIRRADGHWCAELESNTTVTAEYVFMRQALGLDLTAKREALVRYFFRQQKSDGSWGLATNHAGDVSTTGETYLALRILGVSFDDPRMKEAERYVLMHGGLEKMRVFTRINFAMFGLFPWEAVPTMLPELILCPPSSPANIYALSSWARGTMVPLLILFHVKPLFALPNGKSLDNDWLDHLWINPKNKRIPYSEPLMTVLRATGASWKAFFTATDPLLRGYEMLQRELGGTRLAGLRRRAVRRCEDWLLERYEDRGDWAGIFPPMLNGVLALYANGRKPDDEKLRLALEAIERFTIEDDAGFRVEPCQSPVWDTILMMVALVDAGLDDESLEKSRAWITKLQVLCDRGDWKIGNPQGRPGGWSFEYANTWYPDVDDTAAIVTGFLKQDPTLATSESVRLAVEWMISMQNDDGGWAAFDKNNDKIFLNDLPFSDMASLSDPSTPDIAGRVLEALGILDDPKYKDVCARGLAYLRASQEPEGSWFGRWGVNYIYGTSNVLCALSRQHVSAADPMPARAVAWLRVVQNADGGWGECLESYGNRALMGKGRSTASQTAWALMGLLAYVPADDPSVARGIAWLLSKQNAQGSWDEEEFTGTGFPNHFYLRYNLYRHYFPLMALGRFAAAASRR